MIFVTVGTQAPFDRLIKAIDEVALARPDLQFIAQTSKGQYEPKNIKFFEFLTPTQFQSYFDEATLIVAHAGMGTILSAFEKNKPILIMPRLADLGEHRNDHQLATARKFQLLQYLYVAYSINELITSLLNLVDNGAKATFNTGSFASSDLISALRTEIERLNR